MSEHSWKGLRKHIDDSDPQAGPHDPLAAIRAAREAIGKYGCQVPLETWFVRYSTLGDVRQTGATVTPMGLGLFHVEDDSPAMPEKWLAMAIPDEAWDDSLPEIPHRSTPSA